jgi:penicillin-binding protein 1A
MLKGNKRFTRILKYSIVSVTASIILPLIFFLLVYFGAFGPLPDKNEMAAINNEEASLVFSSDSIIIGEYFAVNRTNIKWTDIPDHLVKALIATEDKRFYTHKGYDTRSYFRVFLKSILLGDKSSGGGSTLTQQLVKNLYGRSDFGFLSLPVNKLKEIIIASRIEEVYTKEELILLYLNSVPFGEEVYGVETASHRFFNKPTRELNIEESAVLVGLLKSNTYFNPRLNPGNSLARRNMVLNLMEKEHYLSAEAADSLRKLPIRLAYENVNLESPAGYFVYQVKTKTQDLLEAIRIKTGKEYNLQKDGLKIYTTLNMQVQDMATDAVKSHLANMQQKLDKELGNNIKKQWYNKQKRNDKDYNKDILKRDIQLFDWDGSKTQHISKLDSLWYYYTMLNAAVLITNPKTGAVISWIGGNHFQTLPFDMVLSHRQVASAFKPFLYATALENGLPPCTYLENEENIYPDYKDWEPQNYDNTSTPDSTVAFWYALAHSMNLPTVDLYFKVGRENLINTCNKLIFPVITDEAPSIAIGTLDLSLYEVVRAYASFANEGQMNELVMINKITDAEGNTLYLRKKTHPEPVFSTETTQTITAILQEAINHGTGVRIRSEYGIQSDLAGKTGTAQNFSDAWFVTYTPDLVLGTWVGARTPDVHFFSGNGSGSSLALPVIAKVVRGIENDAELRKKYLTSFSLPDDVYTYLQCDPFLQKGIQGFFNRLFTGKNGSKDSNIPNTDNKEKKSKEKKSFFESLFKRK